MEKIDELLKQLEQARETAQIAVIDMEALAEYAEPGDMDRLQELQQRVEDYLREMAERQGLTKENGAFQLTPQAYKLFQGKLLERIFSELQPSRTGRHQGPILGDGAVEQQQTKAYEFGDSITHMDIPQTMINAMLRGGTELPLRLKTEDIVVHHTRNTPKCATVVVMDMSGSMRYDGQYINVKRMGLALNGLIRREYPGDYLHFIEMYTFAKPRPGGEIIDLLPKPVTIFDPIVRFRVDMSRDDISEFQIPPHFTNIQHSLLLARRFLTAQDTPNRQVILITDGLPTAHFDGSWLYMLYPPDPLTEDATLREGRLCQRRDHDQHLPHSQLVAVRGGHPLRLSAGGIDAGPRVLYRGQRPGSLRGLGLCQTKAGDRGVGADRGSMLPQGQQQQGHVHVDHDAQNVDDPGHERIAHQGRVQAEPFEEQRQYRTRQGTGEDDQDQGHGHHAARQQVPGDNQGGQRSRTWRGSRPAGAPSPTRGGPRETNRASCTSPVANAVITSVAVWLPELPPLEITSGMNRTSQAYAVDIVRVGCSAKAVESAVKNRIVSHMPRFQLSVKIEVRM